MSDTDKYFVVLKIMLNNLVNLVVSMFIEIFLCSSIFGIFWHFSNLTGINDSLNIRLNYLLISITINDFEMNNVG